MRIIDGENQHDKLTALKKLLFVICILCFTLLMNNGCKSRKFFSSNIIFDSTLAFAPHDQYASMRIPALVITKKGTLLAFCEGRIGTSSDWADMNLLMRRSEDGRVMVNIRSASEEHLRGISYSNDGISGWTKPVFDQELFDPVCMATIIRLRDKQNHGILFINPDSKNVPKNPRVNLTARLSDDEGQTWPIKKVLNQGVSGYSDVAVGADGTIYCLYETNLNKGRNYSLVLKRFNLKWLTTKK